MAEGMVLKVAGVNRLKIENVQPSQWIVANALILAEIVRESAHDSALPQTVLDYLSYTAKVGDLSGRFIWSSVMLYDDEYRELQANHGFRWGMDSSHLSTVFLQARDPRPAKSKPRYQSRFNDKTCGYFNTGRKCPHEPACKFAHACEKCGKDHPKVSCTTGVKAQEE